MYGSACSSCPACKGLTDIFYCTFYFNMQICTSILHGLNCMLHNELGTLHTYFEAYSLNFQFHVFMLPESFRSLISSCNRLAVVLSCCSHLIVEKMYLFIGINIAGNKVHTIVFYSFPKNHC